MDTTNEYQTTRVWKKTLKTLKLIAAMTDSSIVETMDRLAAQELARIEKGKTMNNWTAEKNAWANHRLDYITDVMSKKEMDITPESLSQFFQQEEGLTLSAKEAGEWLDKQDWYQKARLTATLDKFLASVDFKSGVISSTKASWGGSGYSVELMADGTWQVLWNNQIGNLYEPAGVILSLPVLNTDDMAEYVDDNAGSEDDFLSEAFASEETELQDELRTGFGGKMRA